MELKIIAKVRFNDHFAYVFNRNPDLKYTKKDGLLYGQDKCVFTVLENRSQTSGFDAFGGRKFDITLENGEVVHCSGEWWDGGHTKLEELLDINLIKITGSSIDTLKRCYVYTSYLVSQKELKLLISEYEKEKGYYYDYREYEKIINFDDMRNKLWTEQSYLKRKIKSLIKEIKKKK